MTKPGLRQSAFKSMQWTVGGRLLKSLLGMGTLVIVARYLSPAEFGIMALVMFITGFGQIFVDAGLRVALVQRAEINELQKNTVFWSSIVFSILLVVLTIVFAGPIARAFDAERIEPFVRWMSIVFPLAALQSISTTTLERRFAFDKMAISDILASLAGVVTAITLVVAGFGILGLVLQQLVQASLGCAIQMSMARWRPRLEFSWTEFRSLMGYGIYVMLTSITTFLTTFLDRPIIAGFFTPQVLGQLTMSQQLVGSPFRIVVQMARKVLFPMFASIQHDRARVAAAYLDMQFAMSCLMAPLCLGLVAMAAPLVSVLLGPEWAPAVPLIQILGIQMLCTPTQDTNQTVLASLGFAKFQFYWMLIAGSLSLGVMIPAAPWGIEAAVGARLAFLLFVTTPLLSVYTMRQMGLHWTSLPRVLSGPILSAVAMNLIVGWVARQLSLSDVATLVICIPLGVMIYVPLIFLLDRKRVLTLVNLVRRRR